MPKTRAMARGAPPTTTLETLPVDVLKCLIDFLLDENAMQTIVRLLQTCNELRDLQPSIPLRRLAWFADNGGIGARLSAHGRSIAYARGGRRVRRQLGHKMITGTSTLLPTSGRASWTVKVDACSQSEGNLIIGIISDKYDVAFGLFLANGRISGPRFNYAPDCCDPNCFSARYHGLRDAHDRQVVDDLHYRADGALIECLVDADAGTLSYRVNGGPPALGLRGLPPGERLRPWVALLYAGDKVTLSPYYRVHR